MYSTHAASQADRISKGQSQTSFRKLTGVMIHLLAWAVFGLFFYYQPIFSGAELTDEFLVKQSVALSLLVLAFYFNSSVLVSRFLFRNKTVWYIVTSICLVLAVAFIDRSANRILTSQQSTNKASSRPSEATSRMMPGAPQQPIPLRRMPLGQRDIFTLIISGLVVGISTAMAATQKWQNDNLGRKELERNKITSELSLLKAQINPHFFFNTLNNIYVLTSVDAKLAGEAIHQLSKMMRYLLYDTQHEETLLSQEIAFVKNYISLMQLRLTDAVKISIDLPTNLHDLPLAPMIFIPFVENAFKHGVSATQQSYIDIVLAQKDKQLELTIHNSIIKDNSVSLDKSSGIGLVNTRRRLDLLYAGKYKLDMKETNAARKYTVHLVLDLS
jgi:two-component system LytT family sensor kinase